MIDPKEFSHSLSSVVATADFIEIINKELKSLEDKITDLEKKLGSEATSVKKKTTAKAE